MVQASQFLALGILLLGTASVACAPRQLYEGERRPPAEVAVLSPSGDDLDLQIASINGESIDFSAELLPGSYDVVIRIRNRDVQGYEFRGFCRLPVSLSAGHRYEVIGESNYMGSSMTAGDVGEGYARPVGLRVRAQDSATGDVVGECRCFTRKLLESCEE